jgi:hypothetical protein
LYLYIDKQSLEIILKSLSDSSINTQDLQLKILQTILPLVTNYPQVHGNILSTALILCFKLHDSKVIVVSSSAVATFRQLILYAFEKCLVQVQKTPDLKSRSIQSSDRSDVNDLSDINNSNIDLRDLERDAFLIFQDLCALTAGEAGIFLKVSSMSKNLGLELIESIITTSAQLFHIVIVDNLVS